MDVTYELVLVATSVVGWIAVIMVLMAAVVDWIEWHVGRFDDYLVRRAVLVVEAEMIRVMRDVSR